MLRTVFASWRMEVFPPDLAPDSDSEPILRVVVESESESDGSDSDGADTIRSGRPQASYSTDCRSSRSVVLLSACCVQAASGATKLLAQKTINTSGNIATGHPDYCSSCGVCIVVCPYNAPSFMTEGRDKGRAQINPVLCKGCGACVASCRSGALHLKGFEDSQLMAMIDNA